MARSVTFQIAVPHRKLLELIVREGGTISLHLQPAIILNALNDEIIGKCYWTGVSLDLGSNEYLICR